MKVRKVRVTDLLAVFVIIWTIVPALQYGTATRVLVASAGVVWFVFSFAKCIQRKSACGPVMAAVCVFCLSTIMVKIMIGNSLVSAIVSQLQNIIFLLVMCMGLFYLEYNEDFLIAQFKWIIVIYMVTAFLTFRQGLLTPGMSRQMVWSQEIAMMYARKGVGGYGTIYSSVFISSGLLFALMEFRQKYKILCISALIIMGGMVYSSGFMIATILQTLMLAFFIFGLYRRKDTTGVFFTIIVMLLVFWVIYNYLFLNNLDVVARLFEGTQYHLKVNDIIKAIQTEEISGKLDGRYSRYMESITALVKFPGIGAEIVGREEEIGGHSTLLDMFARYGVMFSWGYYFALITSIKRIKQIIEFKGYYILLLILMILMGTLNTYSYEHAVAFFIFVPAVMLMVQRERRPV